MTWAVISRLGDPADARDFLTTAHTVPVPWLSVQGGADDAPSAQDERALLEQAIRETIDWFGRHLL